MTTYNANTIQVVDNLSHVWLRPSMYIHSIDQRGVQHCFVEVIDNCIDEHNAGFCDQIKVTLHQDGSLSVRDNGRGIPTGMHESGIPAATLAVSKINAGGKFGSHDSPYGYTGGLHGIGVSAVNALSDWFEMTIYQNGHCYFQRFELQENPEAINPNDRFIPAVPVDDLKIIGETQERGTLIRFKLNAEKFSELLPNEDDNQETPQRIYYSFDAQQIKEKMEALALINPKLELIFIDETQTTPLPNDNLPDYLKHFQTPEGYQGTRWYSEQFEDNMYPLIANLPNYQAVSGIFSLKQEESTPNGTILVQAVFQWVKNDSHIINSYVNSIQTVQNGSHVTGLEQAIVSTLKKYNEEHGTDKHKKAFQGVKNEDYLDGVIGALLVKVNQPKFESQTKIKLNDNNVRIAVAQVVKTYLSDYLEKNPIEARALLDRVVQSKLAREAALRARNSSLLEKNTNSFSISSKLKDCQSKNPELCELFLVEGDSAGGSAESARNRKFQAILPLKGKIANAIKEAHVLKSEEIQHLISALGCGVGQGFNLDKLRYHKIIIMTDADVDGQHIRTLLSTFFHIFLPELLIQGHVYIALTPLYRLKKKKGSKDQAIYLKDDQALEAFKQENNMDLWDVSRFKGLGEMNPEELEETTMAKDKRMLAQLVYDPNLQEEINQTFDILLGKDPSLRRTFISEYVPNPI